MCPSVNKILSRYEKLETSVSMVLFTFREDTDCETHDLLLCECGGSGALPLKEEQQSEARPCQLGTSKITKVKRNEELMNWRHCASPIDDKIEDKIIKYVTGTGWLLDRGR